MRVLYATDGSEAAVAAGEVIVAVADRAEVDLTVVSVVPTGLPAIKHLPASLRSDAEQRTHAEHAAETAAARLGGAGFRVEALTREGRPADVIASTAGELETELLVLGAGPKSMIIGQLLGSVTTDLLHGPTSLLVAREAPPDRRGTVVVGTDGSDHADRATELAARFLDPDRCDVTVVSVAVLITATPEAPYGGYAISTSDEAAEREVTDPAWAHVEQAAATLRAHGFNPSMDVVMGHPVKRLVNIADMTGAAIVVVGSRGRTAPDRTFLGSVSDQMVRRTPACMVVR